MKILVINLKDLRVIRVGQPLHINPSPPHIRKRRWYCVQSEFIVYTGFLNLMNLISMITQISFYATTTMVTGGRVYQL